MSELRTYRRTNHARHILWGALTGGLWLVTGYPVCVLLNRRSRYVTREHPEPRVVRPRSTETDDEVWNRQW